MEKLNDVSEFTKQCWYVWSEGFRYSYKECSDITKAIQEANLLTEAFEKKFTKGE